MYFGYIVIKWQSWKQNLGYLVIKFKFFLLCKVKFLGIGVSTFLNFIKFLGLDNFIFGSDFRGGSFESGLEYYVQVQRS